MIGTPDAHLVAAVLGGETPRFAELVARHEERVRRIVARAVRDAEAREELVQQTFCDAFRSLAQLSGGEKLGAWLGRIARNAVSDHLQRVAREPERGVAELAERAAIEGRGTWIWEEVERLAPAHAEVLRLRYRESRSYAEIAALLALPHSTVRGRIHEARRALRVRLEQHEGDLR